MIFPASMVTSVPRSALCDVGWQPDGHGAIPPHPRDHRGREPARAGNPDLGRHLLDRLNDLAEEAPGLMVDSRGPRPDVRVQHADGRAARRVGRQAVGPPGDHAAQWMRQQPVPARAHRLPGRDRRRRRCGASDTHRRVGSNLPVSVRVCGRYAEDPWSLRTTAVAALPVDGVRPREAANRAPQLGQLDAADEDAAVQFGQFAGRRGEIRDW